MLKQSIETLRLLITLLLLLVLLGLTSCTTKPTIPDLEPPKHQVKDYLSNEIVYAIDVYDPLEGMNRRIYTFNHYFDKYLYLPVVNAYAFVTPDYVEDRVSNFVSNVYEFNNFTNNLFQFKMKETGITAGRFVVNTVVGIGGLWDPATGWGLTHQPESFGQTLGSYGVGNGPYLVLPLFGPSNLRDTSGLVVDSALFNLVGPPQWVDDEATTTVFKVVSAVDKRHRTAFRYYAGGSPFEYELVRMLYSDKQELEIAK